MKKQDVIAEETETVVVAKPFFLAEDVDVDLKKLRGDAPAAKLYARYCDVVNPKHPIPLPSWLQLEELYKDAWRAAASL